MSIGWGRIDSSLSLGRVDLAKTDSDFDDTGIDLAVQFPYAIALLTKGGGREAVEGARRATPGVCSGAANVHPVDVQLHRRRGRLCGGCGRSWPL